MKRNEINLKFTLVHDKKINSEKLPWIHRLNVSDFISDYLRKLEARLH